MSRAERYLPFILAVLAPAWSLVNSSLDLADYPLPDLFLTYLQGMTFLFTLWYLNQWLLNADNKLKRWLGLNTSVIVFNVFFLLLVSLFNRLVRPIGINEELPSWVLITRFAFVILIFNMILRAFKAMRERTELKLQNLNLQAENLKFQVETLKQQINPHFLFNSLNTLLDLVEEDQKTAASYIRSFSSLYRTVLQSSKLDFIPLRDELVFLENYWDLLKMRFHDAIELDMKIEDRVLDKMIPPLSLQFLVENAVKHNEASDRSPLPIQIMTNGDQLIVSNRIIEKSYPVVSEKVGLKNLQQRFSALYQPIEYGVEGKMFVVRLPLK